MDQLNKKRILFVTNPFSGAKSKDHLRQTIETYLDHAVFEYDIQYTEYPSHATTIASDAASNGLFAVIAV
ncbi:MAG TPA: acylglycerol kinase family protein, partial [Saprospiraceae bacterium]|nr:acylglycerol kinase family protein [Saprospiraceae bacterium]